MRQINVNGYKRITKQAARKRFNNCESYYMLPCKIRPGNPWIQAVNVQPKRTWEEPIAGAVYDTHNSFNEIVNAFEYYNCNNETGNYTAFYIKAI